MSNTDSRTAFNTWIKERGRPWNPTPLESFDAGWQESKRRVSREFAVKLDAAYKSGLEDGRNESAPPTPPATAEDLRNVIALGYGTAFDAEMAARLESLAKLIENKNTS